MEALRKVALAYYESGTDEERRLFNQFFQSMDKDGNRRVSYRVFSHFMSLKAHDENMRTRDFFNQLDIDRSGGLDFKEVLTLYYILKSGRPICGQCKIFITNEYFTCMRCFEPQTAAYSICLECFCDKGRHDHNHARSHFVDNFSLLESLRKKPLPNHQPSSVISLSQRFALSRPDNSESSSNLAVVPYNSNIPAVERPSSGISLSQRFALNRPDNSESPSNLAVVPHNSNTPAVGRPSSGISLSQRFALNRPDNSESPSNLAVVPHNSNTPAVGRPSSGISLSQRFALNQPDNSESPSNLAVVPYNSNTPTVERNPWLAAFGLLEAGLQLASIIAGCSIM